MKRQVSTNTSMSIKARTARRNPAPLHAPRDHLLPRAATNPAQPNPFAPSSTSPAMAAFQEFGSRLAYSPLGTADRFWPATPPSLRYDATQAVQRNANYYFGELVPEDTMQCKECHRHFASFYDLVNHAHDYNAPGAIRPYACKFCSKDFENVHQLRQHMQYHRGDKPWECSFCGKALSRYSSYKRHMERHSRL